MKFADPIFYTITACLFGCCVFINIIFSLIVIITIIYNWYPRCRSTANLLVCNSAATLLFYSIAMSIQIPFIIQDDPFPSQTMDIIFCNIRAFLVTTATAVKGYSYLIQAISSFFITILHNQRFLLTFRMNWMMIIVSWITGGIISGGMFVSPLAYEYEPESHFCSLSTRSFPTSFMTIAIFLITAIIIVILYGIILWRTMHFNHINPNSAGALQNKRNLKVFRKIFIFISILIIGGIPYLIAMIFNVIAEAPWPLYSISILFISFAAAVESIALLLTNKQVKQIFFEKLNCCQNRTAAVLVRRTNKVLPHIIINAVPTNIRF